jgi:glycosyltransferase involved in cell wall biosynthesis
MVHWNRVDELKKAIRLTSPHVDKTIIIDGGSTDGSLEFLESEECKQLNVETIIRPWDDNPPGARNAYLKAAGNDGWVLVTDCDEFLEEPAVHTLKQLVAEKDSEGYTLIRFNSHDIQTNVSGDVWEHQSSYWNPMLFKMGPTVRYHGHTHVGLGSLPGKSFNSPFRYFHIKSVPDQWIRGARNYWTTARPAANVHDQQWKNFKGICKKHNLELFADIAQLMRKGTVPEELENWFIENRDSDNPEVRAYFICYFVYLYPEKNQGHANRDFPFAADRKPVAKLTF